MELVKLKMRGSYKTGLALTTILIVLLAAIGITYLFKDNLFTSDSDIEVTDFLSINYIDGKKIYVEDNDVITFSITNTDSKTNYYNIGFLKIRGNGNYKLKYNGNVIMEGSLKSTDELTSDFISITANETKVYELEIINSGKTNLRATLNIRDQEGKIATFADTILKNNAVSENPLTKIGSEIATEDEGLIKTYDDLGISYYFRGNVVNNYVSFANLTWRIVRINGDGTVRLVLDGLGDELTSYYDEGKGFEYKGSHMEETLNNWAKSYLENYKEYLANARFCNDTNHDSAYNFNAYVRNVINNISSLNCLGSNFTSSIGTLTIDEVILAGASPTRSNKLYYLTNEDIKDTWYTITAAKGSSTSMNLFMVESDGNIKTSINGNLFRSIRPVINLIKNIEVEGTGTNTDPYKIIEGKN